MTTPPVPFPRSYWVITGKLLAGFFPGSKDPKEATIKLTALINSGIRHVINLMEPDERDFTGFRFVPYDEVMESIAAKMRISVTFDQLPIKDLSVPTEHNMTRIQNQIDLCIKHGKPVYVHCLGVIGRTGTVVGCYLVRHCLATGKNVLDMIREMRKNSEGADRQSPETKEQGDMVVGWQVTS
jgi:D-ribose pyranose/furanose isomerase RbsD